jgi:IclR family transcriptional regulator, acetate operon repressor
MGVEVVLHTTATGRAWLASMPEAEALRIVAARTSAGEAPAHCQLNLHAVRRIIAETRARGWAISREEAAVGIIALAVVFHEDPEPGSPVAGTLSVAGPAARMDEARHPELLAALRAAAHELEKVWRLRCRQLRESRPRPQPVSITSGSGR